MEADRATVLGLLAIPVLTSFINVYFGGLVLLVVGIIIGAILLFFDVLTSPLL